MFRVKAIASYLGKYSTPYASSARYYPGHGYIAANDTKSILTTPDGEVKTETNIRTITGALPPQHESSHTLIIDNQTKLTVALLTSCKSKAKGHIKIADYNYKDQKVDSSPNAKNKPQYMVMLETPRKIPMEHLNKNEAATALLEENKDKVDKAVIDSKINKKIPLVRVHKDSSVLYHENGRLIEYDKNGNEISSN
jgi:hypothetical protein